MDVKALQARLAAFAAERGWDEVQNPRNLAIAIAGEAGMLLDLFRWLTDAQSNRIESEYKREAAEEAIADLILHTLRLADKLGVDVERAVAKKLGENDANYPLPVEAAPAPAAVAKPAAPKAVEAKLPEAKEAEPKPAETRPADAKPVVVKSAGAKSAEAKATEARSPETQPVGEKPAQAKPGAVKPPEARPAPSDGEALAPEPPAPAEAAPPVPTEKSIPMWLDGILPSRSASARKKQGAASTSRTAPEPAAPPPETPKAPDRSATSRKPEPVAPPPAAPAVRTEALLEPEEEIEAAPPPDDETPEPPPARREPPPPERYAHLDTDAAKALAKSLAKRVDGTRSDDPLLRELHDEVETLRRTLYSPTPKTTWMGDSLKTIRALLEEAISHDVGEAIRARDYIGQIDRMLEP
jgi:NTP pyrophosphatase (non-canonical NTP hydrolase)